MVNLHYENLPEVNYATLSLMKQVNFSIGDYQKYIDLAIRLMWVPERLEKVKWRVAHRDLLVSGNHSNPQPSEGRPAQIWVSIEEMEGAEGTDVVEDFCAANYVIEAPEAWAPKIRVQESDYNLGLLLLDQKPADGEGILYLPPDSYVLSRQKKALAQLRDKPEPEHRGLLRLIEDNQKVNWPEPAPARGLVWEFLTDENVEGTDEQRKFVRIALGTPDFAVLEGPPGSGKTTSICELIIQQIRRGHRVMLCASTHVAVDNVLESLQARGVTEKEVLAVRIGDERKISDDVKDFQLKNRARKERRDLIARLSSIKAPTDAQQYLLDALRNSTDSAESIISRLILESANLVCGTTIGILQHPDIKAKNTRSSNPKPGGKSERDGESEKVVRPFDCLILDEASKTTFQEFLVPALFSRQWVLVGDVKQLSPFVETTHVEDNIKTMIGSESDARVCLDVFQAWEGTARHSTQGVLVIDPEEPEKYLHQAEALGLASLDLSDSGRELSPLDVVGAHVVLAGRGRLRELEPLIPADFVVSPLESATPALNRRHEYWLEHHPWGSEGYPVEEALSQWADNLSWRLARSFELRQDEEASKRFEEEISALVPRWYGEEGVSEFRRDLDKIKRIALPSILELIQKGFGRRDGSRSGSCLTDGMGEGAFAQRHVLLSYQHRMHPDISRAPREFVYDSQSLKDPASMRKNREWSYARYASRSGWVLTVGAKANRRNSNAVEASIVMDELDAFLRWSADHRKPDSDGAPWEIAVLTFYKGQESHLRRSLQQKFKTNVRSQFKAPNGSARITLCTVDRFQGHEADMVILSFVRGKGIGFLDSPNRLNVAITRARYQLVLVGNQRVFSDLRRDTLLRKLARTAPTLRTAWEERAAVHNSMGRAS